MGFILFVGVVVLMVLMVAGDLFLKEALGEACWGEKAQFWHGGKALCHPNMGKCREVEVLVQVEESDEPEHLRVLRVLADENRMAQEEAMLQAILDKQAEMEEAAYQAWIDEATRPMEGTVEELEMEVAQKMEILEEVVSVDRPLKPYRLKGTNREHLRTVRKARAVRRGRKGREMERNALLS